MGKSKYAQTLQMEMLEGCTEVVSKEKGVLVKVEEHLGKETKYVKKKSKILIFQGSSPSHLFFGLFNNYFHFDFFK